MSKLKEIRKAIDEITRKTEYDFDWSIMPQNTVADLDIDEERFKISKWSDKFVLIERKRNHFEHHCGGTWEPILGWSGRYRCSKCRVVGYRRAAAPKSCGYNRKGKFVGAPENIVEYICREKGCNKYVTACRERRCAEHRKMKYE
jgi:hypothetical protein